MNWQPIETAPQGVPVLITGWAFDQPESGRRWYAVAISDGDGWHHPEGEDRFFPPTHWTEMEPPND